jgi:hypothetical protein
MAKQHTASLSI